jgi:diguanylate cyclase (GGDEF)-like protein
MVDIPSVNVLVIFAVIAIAVFFIGLKVGSSGSKENSTDKESGKDMLLARAQINKLKNEVRDLNQKSEKYLQLYVALPEIVKNINSSLSFDDLISAIIRMTKNIVGANIVELYLFENGTNNLKLVAGYNTGRKSGVEVKIGEGLVGKAADTNMTIKREQLNPQEKSEEYKSLAMAAPIRFKKDLLGVIAVGELDAKLENEKRFLAMVGDLAGIALRNSEHLTAAKKEAITDPLTGLFNRRHFFNNAVEAAQKASSYEFPLTIFIFDIDNFKNYNDTNGHSEGDVLLKKMGSILKEHTRSTNIVARYGGEEFIVLLKDCNTDEAMVYAENIRKAIESHPFNHREKQPMGFVSISGGVASYPHDGNSIKEIVELADKALYFSKGSGKNRITRYESNLVSSV